MKPTLLFVVEDAYQISGQGYVPVPGPIAGRRGRVVRIGDCIRLLMPDGRHTDTTVHGVEMIARGPHPAVTTTPILMPREITKDQVPPGTQVFAIGKASSGGAAEDFEITGSGGG
jgi:translation elongation factor EF-Tu-like GTPase